MTEPASPPRSALRQVGLVVHPTRPVDRALEEVGAWAPAHGLRVGQVPVPGSRAEWRTGSRPPPATYPQPRLSAPLTRSGAP